MDGLAQLVVWLNAVANALGTWGLAPISALPGWLSATLIAALTGLLLLVIFKHTSNQRAVRRARDDIKANLLALKLFKDSTFVSLRAQGAIFAGAFRLLLLAIVPMAVMTGPVVLLLGQLGAWYQYRPLRVGEEAVVTLKLNGGPEFPWPAVRLEPSEGIEVTVGPVRVLSKREICWNVGARQSGRQRLVFHVDDLAVDKELAVGDGFMRLSKQRPAWDWSEALLYPCERPFGPDSPVQSITIDYPERLSWTAGTDWWVVYWFVVSMFAALAFRRWLNVEV
jgi:hypothetical protein